MKTPKANTAKIIALKYGEAKKIGAIDENIRPEPRTTKIKIIIMRRAGRLGWLNSRFLLCSAVLEGFKDLLLFTSQQMCPIGVF